MPNEKIIEDFYSNYKDFRANPFVSYINGKQNYKLLRKYGLTKKNKLLDWGCGENWFVNSNKPNKWIGYDKYKMWDRYDGIFDFITLWGVLEHLPNPVEELQELTNFMKKDSKIVLKTVTTESNIPFQYKPPEHLVYWNYKSMEILFKKAGLKLIEYKPYEMIQDSDVYLNILLRTVPKKYKELITHQLPKYVHVPTNEVIVIGEK